MDNAKKIPLWVLLAFSSIQTRKTALILIWSSVIFTAYCLPWTTFTGNQIIAKIFLIDDWSWVAMMIPICIWYVLSLRWMDKNNGWKSA